MKAFTLFATLFASAFVSLATAQDYETSLPQLGARLDGKTIVKTNLLGALTSRTYGIGVERILSENFSLQLSSHLTPKGSLPLFFSDILGWKDKHKRFEAELALRLYLSKTGYGHGFYFQALYNYNSITTYKTWTFSLPNDRHIVYDNEEHRSIHGFGLGLGVQWLIGRKRNIVIDWTILQLSRDPNSRLRDEYYLPKGADITPAERKYLVDRQGRGDGGIEWLTAAFPIDFNEDASYGIRKERETVWLPNMRLSIGFRF